MVDNSNTNVDFKSTRTKRRSSGTFKVDSFHNFGKKHCDPNRDALEEDPIAVLLRILQILCDKKDQPLLSKPTTETITVWRNVISSVYYHPCILRHPDLNALYQLFLLFGVKFQCDNTDIYVKLDHQPSEEESCEGGNNSILSKGAHHFPKPPCKHFKLRPSIPSSHGHFLITIQLVFGHIENCEYDLESRVLKITNYTMMPYIKKNVEEMVLFLLAQPRQLYSDSYGFIYDFLIRLGVKPRKINAFVKLLVEGGKAETVDLDRKVTYKKKRVLEEDQENLETDEEDESLVDGIQVKHVKQKNKELRVNGGVKLRIMTELNNNQTDFGSKRRHENNSADDGQNDEELDDEGLPLNSNDSASSSSSSSSSNSSDSEDSVSDHSNQKYNRRTSTQRKSRKDVWIPSSKTFRLKQKYNRKKEDEWEKKRLQKRRKASRASSRVGNFGAAHKSNSALGESTTGSSGRRKQARIRNIASPVKKREYKLVNNDDKPISCPSSSGCTARFQRRNGMLQHFRNLHPNENYLPLLRSSSGFLRRLSRTGCNEKELINGPPTDTSHSLNKRLSVNNEEKPIACPSSLGCPVRFLWPNTMRNHFRRKHPSEILPANLAATRSYKSIGTGVLVLQESDST